MTVVVTIPEEGADLDEGLVPLEPVQKHLPGQHNQQAHSGQGGGGGSFEALQGAGFWDTPYDEFGGADRVNHWLDENPHTPTAGIRTPVGLDAAKVIRQPGRKGEEKRVDTEKVERFAEAMRRGERFPPIQLEVDDKGKVWIFEGNHRARAAALAGDTVEATVLWLGGGERHYPPREFARDFGATALVERHYTSSGRHTDQSVHAGGGGKGRYTSTLDRGRAGEEMGDKLKVDKDIDEVAARKLLDGLNDFPPGVLKALADRGVTIVIGKKPITDHDPDISGYADEVPEGYRGGVTWANVAGAYNPRSKLVVLTDSPNTFNVRGMALHEVGHAIDFTNPGSAGAVTDRKVVQDAYIAAKNRGNIAPYYDQDSRRASTEEWFASIVSGTLMPPGPGRDNHRDDTNWSEADGEMVRSILDEVTGNGS